MSVRVVPASSTTWCWRGSQHTPLSLSTFPCPFFLLFSYSLLLLLFFSRLILSSVSSTDFFRFSLTRFLLMALPSSIGSVLIQLNGTRCLSIPHSAPAVLPCSDVRRVMASPAAPSGLPKCPVRLAFTSSVSPLLVISPASHPLARHLQRLSLPHDLPSCVGFVGVDTWLKDSHSHSHLPIPTWPSISMLMPSVRSSSSMIGLFLLFSRTCRPRPLPFPHAHSLEGLHTSVSHSRPFLCPYTRARSAHRHQCLDLVVGLAMHHAWPD